VLIHSATAQELSVTVTLPPDKGPGVHAGYAFVQIAKPNQAARVERGIGVNVCQDRFMPRCG
jgi:hypothetical protein